VIAAGFDSGQLPYKKVDVRREQDASAARPAMSSTVNGHQSAAMPSRPTEPVAGTSGVVWSPPTTTSGAHTATRPATPARRAVELDEELDVPDFLK